MSTEITTAEELDALPENSVIRDSMGDIGVLFGARVWYPETEPLSRDFVSRHYLPATILYRPDRPTLSDDDLREEAARRGMTVVDAVSKVRLHDVWHDSQRDDTQHPGYSWDEARAVRFLAALGIGVSE